MYKYMYAHALPPILDLGKLKALKWSACLSFMSFLSETIVSCVGCLCELKPAEETSNRQSCTRCFHATPEGGAKTYFYLFVSLFIYRNIYSYMHAYTLYIYDIYIIYVTHGEKSAGERERERERESESARERERERERDREGDATSTEFHVASFLATCVHGGAPCAAVDFRGIRSGLSSFFKATESVLACRSRPLAYWLYQEVHIFFRGPQHVVFGLWSPSKPLKRSTLKKRHTHLACLATPLLAVATFQVGVL